MIYTYIICHMLILIIQAIFASYKLELSWIVFLYNIKAIHHRLISMMICCLLVKRFQSTINSQLREIIFSVSYCWPVDPCIDLLDQSPYIALLSVITDVLLTISFISCVECVHMKWWRSLHITYNYFCTLQKLVVVISSL